MDSEIAEGDLKRDGEAISTFALLRMFGNVNKSGYPPSDMSRDEMVESLGVRRGYLRYAEHNFRKKIVLAGLKRPVIECSEDG